MLKNRNKQNVILTPVRGEESTVQKKYEDSSVATLPQNDRVSFFNNPLSLAFRSLVYIILTFYLLVSCVSYPRYTTHSPSHPEKETRIDKLKMTRIIESYLGEPYSKYDCSALVHEIYRRYSGISLPSNTENLYKIVKKVDKEELSFGDLVFFTEDGFTPFHVGIYIGDNRFVHSSSSQGVIISSLDEKYYAKRFFGGRRIIQ